MQHNWTRLQTDPATTTATTTLNLGASESTSYLTNHFLGRIGRSGFWQQLHPILLNTSFFSSCSCWVFCIIRVSGTPRACSCPSSSIRLRCSSTSCSCSSSSTIVDKNLTRSSSSIIGFGIDRWCCILLAAIVVVQGWWCAIAQAHRLSTTLLHTAIDLLLLLLRWT